LFPFLFFFLNRLECLPFLFLFGSYGGIVFTIYAGLGNGHFYVFYPFFFFLAFLFDVEGKYK